MPFGVEQVARAFNRSRRGLYAGRRILSGNKISEDGGNKTRRVWKPNVQTVSLWSDALHRTIQLRATTHALRCIDKAGGLDRYLLKTREDHVQSDLGMKLKAQIHAARQQHQHLPPAATAGVAAEGAEATSTA